MKCYRHQATDAVGLCKSCCKGLCKNCATEVARGLACRGSCETAVRALNNRFTDSAEYPLSGALGFALCAFLSAAAAVYVSHTAPLMVLALAFLSICLIALSVVFYKAYRSVKAHADEIASTSKLALSDDFKSEVDLEEVFKKMERDANE